MSELDIELSYDEGYFDKDAQGWCARNVQVTREGSSVIIRRWGDDNGTMAYDETVRGTLGPVFPDRGLVMIVDDKRALAYVDLSTRRLRSASEYATTWFVPAFTSRDEAMLARMAAHAVPIARVLGASVSGPPVAPVLSPPRPSSTFEGATERAAEQVDAGVRWQFLIRDTPGDCTLAVTLTAGTVHVGLHVESATRAGVVFTGPLERFAEATAERDRQIAQWNAG